MCVRFKSCVRGFCMEATELLDIDINDLHTLSRSIIEMDAISARQFLLKPESYCNLDLPSYFDFSGVLCDVGALIEGKFLGDLINKPEDHEGVNYTLVNNKDGKFAWRPFQLINPVLYVSLVHVLTSQVNWELLMLRFQDFSIDKRIRCFSLPVQSFGEKKDKAVQISQWLSGVERKTIELALEYECMLETDISDCYGSIYTHSIAWAIHGKAEAKKKGNRNNGRLLGAVIDKALRQMANGQTNGLPQGSVLTDFIAEIVLGYADLQLSRNIGNTIQSFEIVRFRDDYRIFTNSPQDAEAIVKVLSEVLLSLGLKLNPNKTKANSNVIRGAIKEDKASWLNKNRANGSFQSQLLVIHDHAVEYPNGGSLLGALDKFYRRLLKVDSLKSPVRPLISIVVDLAYRNPRVYPIAFAIVSKLLAYLEGDGQLEIVTKIQTKFMRLPNTGYMQIFLQRVSKPLGLDVEFEEPLCRQVDGLESVIWDSEWIVFEELKKVMSMVKIVDRERLAAIDSVVQVAEIEVFTAYDS